MVQDFCAYGNENYHDTVTKSIPAFFRYYDVRFMPQETLITMDYPTICPIIGKSGIDAIESYLEYISLEQTFMNALPREYVYGVLFKFQANYRKQFYNICTILLRHILGHMMIGKSLGEEGTKEDYELLQAMLLNNDPKKIEMRLLDCLEKLISEKYHEDKALENYLQGDLKDFVTELRVASQNDRMDRVVVL